MTIFQLKKIVLALGLSASISAQAAGLGNMLSNSKLGEPLNAEIELLAVTPAEISTIQAALASDLVYQEQMLEKPASYPYIKIEVANNTKGQPVLRLTSTQPITEAFLDMLIQVDWASGRLVKEYTLLLDPPGYESNSVAEAPVLPKTPVVTVPPPARSEIATPSASNAPLANVATAPAKPVITADEKKTTATKPATEPKQADASLTTVKGDTLYAIARQMHPEDVSVEQMLVGLYQNNPDAFDDENLHRLRTGKILRLPDQEALRKISQQQARSILATHTAAWQAYKNKLAAHTQESKPAAASQAQASQSGKIASAGNTTPPASNSHDVLKLSSGTQKKPDASPSSHAASAEEAVNAAKEDQTAKAQALKEEQSRADDLKAQVENMKKLMALKNDAMAKAQKEAADAEVKHTPESAPEKAHEQVADAVKQPEPAPTATPAEPVQADAPVAALPQNAHEAEPQASFLTAMLKHLKEGNPAMPAILVGVPFLLGLWLWIRSRRKKQMDTFEQAIVTTPVTQMDANTVFGNTQAATSSDTSFLTDFSQSPVGGVIDAHDVDPIAEAEVYMAYGRDAQAEEILKDAMVKDPTRQELKLKLLEIYHNTENVAAFATLAAEMHAKTGASDASWSKVAAMGQKIDPENPLYQTGAQPQASADQALALSDSNTETVPENGYSLNFEAPTMAVETKDAPVDVLEPTSSLDLLDSVAVSDVLVSSETAEVSANLNDDGLTFELGAVASSPATTVAEVEPTPVVNIEEVEAAINLLAAEVEASEPVETDRIAKALDLPTLDFEAEEDSASPMVAEPIAGTPALSPNDAVFEKLPDLAFELGSASASMDDIEATLAAELPTDIEDSPDITVASATAPEANVIETLPEISLELGAPQPSTNTATEPEPEEVDTKLDLIKAYIDMEDMIGAKELIQEVLEEGGPVQREKAQSLLTQLSILED